MKLRALVVEDEWAARNYLVELLEDTESVEVVGALASPEDARKALELSLSQGGIDVAFVDVRLVGSDADDEGLSLVRAVARKSRAPLFVLATAYGQHALEAFDLGVADYLLKPFTLRRVEECVERLQLRHRAPTGLPEPAGPSRIVARRKRALVFLRPDEVWAFEAAERLAYVHTERGRLDVDLSLSAVEASFGRSLLRVHRNWLVNTQHVMELEGHGSDTEVLVGGRQAEGGGVRVPVARERAQAVREVLLGDTMGIRTR
jgi:DNA-binding LytR/AlgR family response regulator